MLSRPLLHPFQKCPLCHPLRVFIKVLIPQSLFKPSPCVLMNIPMQLPHSFSDLWNNCQVKGLNHPVLWNLIDLHFTSVSPQELGDILPIKPSHLPNNIPQCFSSPLSCSISRLLIHQHLHSSQKLSGNI
ncbi:hypothetical protein M758_UG113300 [Ceratodon purpureus]|nr:hypothetical protein M758_UG113300 [Ceratodon purpureus]